MKLGINAVGLYPGKIGGAEQYLRNIVAKLEEYEDIETYLFLNDTAMDTFTQTNARKLIAVDMKKDRDAQLNCYIHLHNIDVWFCPFFHMIPLNCGIPTVTTIFDIQQDYFPQNFDKYVLQERIQRTWSTVRHTDLILTISEFSKQTLIDKYHLNPEKIKVTYLDGDASFSKPLNQEHLEKIRAELPKEFILFPATMWPHKNHVNLIKGFASAKKKYGLPLKLVFTGAQERETEEIVRTINDNHLREDVVYLGYRPQEDMRYIFACANVLAFPSLFEGFGIPLVEAMAAHVPIICSTSSCVPEIAGDAAVQFDAQSPEEIAEAIHRVYTDDALRSQLVKNGTKRRAMFSWEKCAKETVDYLKSVYKPRKPAVQKLSSHPRVTVVTPSYNQGEFIKDTIDSVLAQTYDNIEYIVMDGGSTDNTVEILKSYGNRIKWVSEKDGGQADAVNKGIRVAEGEIIGWLNSDDTYYPDSVEKVVSTLLQHPEMDMVYGEGDYIDREGHVTGVYNTKMFDYNELAKECFICQPTAFFTKEIVEKAGMLNADLQLCMDYELWMRIGKIGNVLYIPETLATSRMYEDNKTLSRRAEVYKECCREVKRHYGYVPHSWIYGYADYKKKMHPQGKLKYYYAYLFLRYNYNRPGYFWECYKKYKRIRSAAKPTEKNVSHAIQVVQEEGKYSDGWLGKKYVTSLAPEHGKTSLLFRGISMFQFPAPLVLTITINGLIRQSFTISKIGKFSCEMRLPVGQDAERYNVMIEANQTIVPKQLGNSVDDRELSVLMCSLSLKRKIMQGSEVKPLVSIITPSYNQGQYIRAAIESVLTQDYENIEYIVVDGGSTDNTLSVLEEYKDRLKYISEPDSGQSNAINKGFRMAKGSIVAWLNSDDVYEPGCISHAVKIFEKNPSVALVYGEGYIIDSDGNKLKRFEYSRNFSLWALVHIWDYIMQPTAFFRADALKSVGYLNEKLNWTMDWELWMKLALRYDVAYTSQFLACSREYAETKTSTGSDRRLAEILELMQRFSGEERPFGYEIYNCSELLAHAPLTPERHKEVEARLVHLLTFQPVPDADDRCMETVNFTLRPGTGNKILQVNLEQDKPVQATVMQDGEIVYEGTFGMGITPVKLACRKEDTCSQIQVTVHSKELERIKAQRESWVKMSLVDRND